MISTVDESYEYLYYNTPILVCMAAVLSFPHMSNAMNLLQTHINFPRFLPIFPDFLERLSHLAPIY
jgi:hypothetical protein